MASQRFERGRRKTGLNRNKQEKQRIHQIANPHVFVRSPVELQGSLGNKGTQAMLVRPVPYKTPKLPLGTHIQAQFGHVPATADWSNRVQAASSQHTEMDLLNQTFIAQNSASRFPDLSLPVLVRPHGREIDGGVYYDNIQSDPGMTNQRTATISSGSFCTPNRTEDYVFIVLGPNALSTGTPVFSEHVLYHEYVHFRQRKGRQHSRFLQGSSGAQRQSHIEALAHAESFREYFGRLYWQGSSSMPRSTVATQTRVAEALYPLQAINRLYYISANDAVRAEVRRLVLSVVESPNREEKKTFLQELAGHLDLHRMAGISLFKDDLLRDIDRLS